jgi:8-oxo-dGTP pyrophosphatase MutT (NUDIX family)
MVSNDGLSGWMLPGGTVERNENPIHALRRELQEEADIEIKNYKLIGFLEMKSLNNVTKYTWNRTEMFFVAKVDKILPQTEDPAVGFIMHRDFYTVDEMAFNFMKWGKISKFLAEYVNKLKM